MRAQPSITMALGLLCLVAFLNYFDRSLLYPLLPLIAHEFSLSETAQGQLAGGFHVVYALTALGLGPLCDRIARKKALVFALLLWSAVTFLSGTASSFGWLLLWRSLTGFGEGTYFPIASSVIGDLFSRSRRGFALSIHGASVTLGGACGMAAAGYLGSRFGWRSTFFLALVPGLLLALFLARYFAEPARRAAEGEMLSQAASPDARRPYLQIVFHPRVLLLSVAAAAAGWATQSMITFFVSFLHKRHGLALSHAGLMGGIGFGATLIGQLLGGSRSDRLARYQPRWRPLLVAIPYLLAAPALVLLGWSGSGTVALCAYGIVHMARGFAEPSIFGSIIDVLGPNERATGTGFLLFWTFVGASVGPIVTGSLIDGSGHGVAFLQLAAASLLAGVMALGASRSRVW